MPNIRVVVIALLLAVSFASMAVCAEKVPSKEGAVKVKKTRKDFTKEDFISRIKNNLDRFPEIVDLVQGLSRSKDAAGNIFYVYQGKKIEDLDKELLSKLYARVSNDAVRLRTERINKQLEAMSRAERLSRQTSQVSPVPKIPKAPATPPTVTQLPKTPPSTTTRR
ncbi:MAG: hypothetical protein WCY36_01120 [Candidatus Omnitrophota bacterium]